MRRTSAPTVHPRLSRALEPELDSSEAGAVVLFVVVFMVVLVGVGAIVIDLGALLHERRQLQNGADAAAFAVAIDCAHGACVAPSSTAATYASSNAADGFSAVDELCGRGPGLIACAVQPPHTTGPVGYVKVTTSTLNKPGSASLHSVHFLLSPLLNVARVDQTVHATAVVAWGTPSTALTIPLLLSKCIFDPTWFGADGAVNFPVTPIRISLNESQACGSGWPSGFDFIADPSGSCSLQRVTITGGSAALPAGQEGNLPQCRSVIKQTYELGKTLTVPVMYSRTKAGAGSEYFVDGFASIVLCGYAIGGGYTATNCPTVCTGKSNEYRLCGYFKTATLTDGDLGSGTDYGTRILKAVG